jgi:hypothetical protein
MWPARSRLYVRRIGRNGFMYVAIGWPKRRRSWWPF